jgi:hypothetical protein
MKIYNAPVSQNIRVRPAQVLDMIRHCEALQAAFDDLSKQVDKNFRKWWQTKARAPALAKAWLTLPEVKAFREAALSNHFVCGNWETFDELESNHAHYFQRADVQAGDLNIPEVPDFLWMRRFIHSIVIWDVSTPEGDHPLLEVARTKFNWKTIAELLQHQLNQADHVSDDPWVDVRRQYSVQPST